jgi:hypothetical protein
MSSKDGRSTEQEIGQAVLRFLKNCPSGRADIRTIKDHIRNTFPLTDADQEQSETRGNEEMWEQQVRNLVSHRGAEGNIINEGLIAYAPGYLEVTDAGRYYLKSKGL